MSDEKNPSDQIRERAKTRLKKFNINPEVNSSRLSKELATHPSHLFTVGEYRSVAEHKADKSKSRLKVVKAKIDRQLRKKYTGKSKLSEKAMEHRIACHPLVCKAADEAADAKLELNIWWAAFQAMQTKTEMLVNISQTKRKEMDAGLSSRVRRDKRASEKVKKWNK